MAQHLVVHLLKAEEVVALEGEILRLQGEIQRMQTDQYRLLADLSRYHAALDDIRYMRKLLDKAGISYRLTSI